MKTIKQLFFLTLFVFALSVSYGQRVLSQEERQQLLGSSEFLEKCQWAVKDYAVFMSTNDGSSATTEALKIKWGKDRIIATNILKHGVTDPQLVSKYLNLSKSKQFTLGASPQSNSALIAAWVSANSFEEFVGAYFSLEGDDINMSIGN